MKFKTLIMLAALSLVPINVNAKPYFGIEFLWGIGKSAEKSEGINSRWCKNRTWGNLKGFGLRLGDDNVEAHLSRYQHDTDAKNCNRSSWAIGVGPYISSKDDNKQNDVFISWNPGLAYHFDSTWRNQGHFTLFNRFNAGFDLESNSNHQYSVELGYLTYGGIFEPNHGEDFFTIGLRYEDLKDNSLTSNNNNTNGSNGSNGNSGSNGSDGSDGSDGDSGSNNNDGADDNNEDNGPSIVINDNDTITINDNDTITVNLNNDLDNDDSLDYDHHHHFPLGWSKGKKTGWKW